MSWELHKRRTSASSSSRTRHISRLSNLSNFDESVEFSSQQHPLTSRHAHHHTTKTVKLRFTVQSKGKDKVALVGSGMELGRWDIANRLALECRPGQFPTWTSREITFFCPSHELNLEYKYLYVDSTGACRPENTQSNRQISLKLLFTNTYSLTVLDTIDTQGSHIEDSRYSAPIFRELAETWNIYKHVQSMNKYLLQRAERVSLRDYLAVAHFFRFVSSSYSESDSIHLERELVKLIVVIMKQSTEEIEPIVRDICCSMAAFSCHLRTTMQRITDRSAVEGAKVPLGCEAPVVLDLVAQLLSDTSQQYMARAIIINSVRRTLAKLRGKSRKPELLLLYDVWLEETEMKYMEERFEDAGADNLASELHKIVIILESLELNGVSPKETAALRTQLEAVWKDSIDKVENLQAFKAILLELVELMMAWLSRYANPQALSSWTDQIGLKETLGSIGAKFTHPLLLAISKTLRYLDRTLGEPHYLPLCKGIAVGKVVQLRALSEVPVAYASVIAVLTEMPSSWSLPESVRAIVLHGQQHLDSRLLASCCARRVVLAQVTSLPARVETCVQVNVLDEGVKFL